SDLNAPSSNVRCPQEDLWRPHGIFIRIAHRFLTVGSHGLLSQKNKPQLPSQRPLNVHSHHLIKPPIVVSK
ncbi:MAG: hypothetical protein ACQKBU_04960, partial [Verrucomicrobiales bacterium]